MERTIRASDYFKMMNIVHAVQGISLLAFSALVFYLNQQTPEKAFANGIQYALIATALVALISSQFVPRMMLKKIDPALELKYKVPKYLPVALVRAACLEAAGLIACIAAFITGYTYFLLIIPLLLLVFFFYRPTKTMVATELNLTAKEKSLLDRSDTMFIQIKNKM